MCTHRVHPIHWQLKCDYLYVGLCCLQHSCHLVQLAYVLDVVFVVVQGLPVCWSILCTKCVWWFSTALLKLLQSNGQCALIEILQPGVLKQGAVGKILLQTCPSCDSPHAHVQGTKFTLSLILKTTCIWYRLS